MAETKQIVFNNLKAEAKGRVRAGICAVFGNVDSVGDRIHPGAFSKTIQENFRQKNRVKFLWNHDFFGFTTAQIKDLVEVSRDDLPAEVLAKAPEATGGLKVVREYYDDDTGNKILTRIDSGDINEMSFAFDIVKYGITEEDTGLEDMPKRRIREIQEVKLYDCSDVQHGANMATVAAGAKNIRLLPLGTLHQQLLLHNDEIKAGRRNSSSDETLINQIHSLAVDLGAKCEVADDEPKSDEPKNEAGADDITPLNSGWFDLLKIENQILEIK